MTGTIGKIGLGMLFLGCAFINPESAHACLSNAQVQQAISQGKAQRLSSIKRSLGNRGEIIRVALCDSGGGLVYRLTVLGNNGQVQQVTLDARTGRQR